ncbi:histidine phosphatase family protein [Salinivibrio sp. PR6]|uniref:histidine phosphatase family protein n=1 Tax=unclassified Salinivibrio TaxID=2636825 RepID=UPI0009883300|nr:MULTISPECIES: histidine phosphatase family protein [unclassified Salinivibrio]OOE73343.1 histidine phosphatase family protein [Salinivibrio sp. ML290]OOE79583.1 histidine phosphatase family protein [Salinivibrio sp. PR6]
MKVVFVRHGKTDYSLADARQMSQLEKDYAPLQRACIPAIQSLADHPSLQHADIILSSPYTRALQTAEILNRQLQKELFVEHDLREWQADIKGSYIPLSERDRRWIEYRELFANGNEVTNAGYESATALYRRVTSVLDTYQDYNTIAVIAHFNVIESLVGYREQGIEYGEVIEVDYQPSL